MKLYERLSQTAIGTLMVAIIKGIVKLFGASGNSNSKTIDTAQNAGMDILTGSAKKTGTQPGAANQANTGKSFSPAGNTMTYFNCSSCGAMIPSGSIFCNNCGAKQPEQNRAITTPSNQNRIKPVQQVSDNPSESQRETKNTSDNKKPAGLLKTVVIIALLVLIGFLLLSQCSGDKLSGTTWKYTYDAGSYTIFSFSKGTVTTTEVNLITSSHRVETAKYKIHGNMIDFDPGYSNALWEIKGKQLILTIDGEKAVLDRQ